MTSTGIARVDQTPEAAQASVIEVWIAHARGLLDETTDAGDLGDLMSSTRKARGVIKALGAARELRTAAIELELNTMRRIAELGVMRDVPMVGSVKAAYTYVAKCSDEQFAAVLAFAPKVETPAGAVRAHHQQAHPLLRRGKRNLPHQRDDEHIRRGLRVSQTLGIGTPDPDDDRAPTKVLLCPQCGWWTEVLDTIALAAHTQNTHRRRPIHSERIPRILTGDRQHVIVPLEEFVEWHGGQIPQQEGTTP